MNDCRPSPEEPLPDLLRKLFARQVSMMNSGPGARFQSGAQGICGQPFRFNN